MDSQYTLTAISVAAILVCLRLALGRQRRGVALGRPAESTITWLGSYSAAFQRALDICRAMEIELSDADPNRGTIFARSGLTVMTARPNVRIELRTQEGITTLTVTVASGVLNVGQADRVARRFVEIWDRMPDPI